MKDGADYQQLETLRQMIHENEERIAEIRSRIEQMNQRLEYRKTERGVNDPNKSSPSLNPFNP